MKNPLVSGMVPASTFPTLRVEGKFFCCTPLRDPPTSCGVLIFYTSWRYSHESCLGTVSRNHASGAVSPSITTSAPAF
jgi:hypothetical protein